jgi:hypothetical protein
MDRPSAGAAELPIAGAVGYYGSQIGQHLERRPRCPVQLHFGGNDQSTPPAMIEGLRKAHAAVEVYVQAARISALQRRRRSHRADPYPGVPGNGDALAQAGGDVATVHRDGGSGGLACLG